MPVLQNDRFLRALLRQPTDRTPLWLMRQAGRYLPEYNATRSRAGSFLDLAKSPAYATEVTLQPLERYPLDAAILFSDILTVPDAMGLGLSFETGEGPKFARPLRDEAAVRALRVPDMAELQYVFGAVAEIRRALVDGQGNQRVPLIGFSGSPWTLACYMVEGAGSSDFRHVKAMLYSRPDLMQHILDVNAQAVADYLNAQIEAGAQAVMIFDTWGGVLADGVYQHYSLQSMQRVLARLKRSHDGVRIPVIMFTKGGGQWLEEIAGLTDAPSPDAIGLDWTTHIGKARLRVGERCALQGNLDPNVLFAPEDTIRAEARAVLDRYAEGRRPGQGLLDGHVFNLGHGISQFTPPESVAILADEVASYSAQRRVADAAGCRMSND